MPEEGEEEEGGGAVEDGAHTAHLRVRLLVPVQHLYVYHHRRSEFTKHFI